MCRQYAKCLIRHSPIKAPVLWKHSQKVFKLLVSKHTTYHSYKLGKFKVQFVAIFQIFSKKYQQEAFSHIIIPCIWKRGHSSLPPAHWAGLDVVPLFPKYHFNISITPLSPLSHSVVIYLPSKIFLGIFILSATYHTSYNTVDLQ